jgi:hypothetical protein
MKYVVMHDVYGEIRLEEGFWTSKKLVSINGVALKQIGKMRRGQCTYEYETEEGTKQVTAKGAFTTGIQLTIDGETIQMDKGAAWYEFAACALMWIVMLVWGIVPNLYAIWPVLGGALGGALHAILALTAMLGMKSTKNIALKFAIWIGVFIGSMILSGILAINLALILI